MQQKKVCRPATGLLPELMLSVRNTTKWGGISKIWAVPFKENLRRQTQKKMGRLPECSKVLSKWRAPLYTIMKVLMVEPGKSPYAAEIESGLKSLQAAVGGDIQAVYPYEDPVALICNEEGKLMGLPLNRALFDDDGHIYDIVSGNFLIVGLGEEDFTDLSPDLMEKYGEQFKYPEKFARIAGEIIAVKQPATNEHQEKPMMHHSGPDL